MYCTCSGELCTEFPCGSGCSIRFSVLLSRLSSACDCSNTLSELLLRDWGWSSSPVDRGPRSFRSDIRLQSMLFACSFRVAYSCRACSDLGRKYGLFDTQIVYCFFINAATKRNNFLNNQLLSRFLLQHERRIKIDVGRLLEKLIWWYFPLENRLK